MTTQPDAPERSDDEDDLLAVPRPQVFPAGFRLTPPEPRPRWRWLPYAFVTIFGLSLIAGGLALVGQPTAPTPTTLQNAQVWCKDKGRLSDGNATLSIALTGDTSWADVNCLLAYVDTPDADRTRIAQASAGDGQQSDSWGALDMGVQTTVRVTWGVGANGVLTVTIHEP
jgi:hypothetical protein